MSTTLNDIIADSEFDPDNRAGKSYNDEWVDGHTDANFMIAPKENRPADWWEKWSAIRDTLVTAVYNFEPTPWQRGYADAFDMVAIANGIQDEQDHD